LAGVVASAQIVGVEVHSDRLPVSILAVLRAGRTEALVEFGQDASEVAHFVGAVTKEIEAVVVGKQA
jgi:hypothetical protein